MHQIKRSCEIFGLARMFHKNAEFWGNLSEPVFAIACRSIAIATVQATVQGGS